MIQIVQGQQIRGKIKDSKRPEEIQIKMEYNEFSNLLKASEVERLKFREWLWNEVIPALAINGKMSIIFPTHF